jgi:hypothetical protein
MRGCCHVDQAWFVKALELCKCTEHPGDNQDTAILKIDLRGRLELAMTITHSDPSPSTVESDRRPSELIGAAVSLLDQADQSGERFDANEHPAHWKYEEASQQKPVKKSPLKQVLSVPQLVHAKEFAMHKRSILSNSTPHNPRSKMRAKTLLDQPLPTEETLKPWRDADEFTKLAAAATPLYWMAKKKDWELKAFTLVLEKNLSARMDKGDVTAFEYIRDQLTRHIKKALGAGAEFLYGIEKAPRALSDDSSRRRWHLHGLIIGPAGFAATGKTPLRKALKAIKGEADSDLMFQIPGEKLERDMRASAISWCFYAVKNALSVQIDPVLAEAYDLASSKQTFVSAVLKSEARRWYEGAKSKLSVTQLVQGAPTQLYRPN